MSKNFFKYTALATFAFLSCDVFAQEQDYSANYSTADASASHTHKAETVANHALTSSQQKAAQRSSGHGETVSEETHQPAKKISHTKKTIKKPTSAKKKLHEATNVDSSKAATPISHTPIDEKRYIAPSIVTHDVKKEISTPPKASASAVTAQKTKSTTKQTPAETVTPKATVTPLETSAAAAPKVTPSIVAHSTKTEESLSTPKTASATVKPTKTTNSVEKKATTKKMISTTKKTVTAKTATPKAETLKPAAAPKATAPKAAAPKA